jgi:hypothetical protein
VKGFHRVGIFDDPEMTGYDPLDSESYDLIEIEGGLMLRTHAAGSCLVADGCPIHAPSDHALRNAPMKWAPSMRMLFRRCTHGELHPDPDSLGFENTIALVKTLGGTPTLGYDGWHPCCVDKCCGLTDIELVGVPFDEGQAYMVLRSLNDGGDGTQDLWAAVDPPR